MSRSAEAKTRRNHRKHKTAAMREDYQGITGEALLDMTAPDMAITTDGEVDAYGRFTGHYTNACPNGRRDRTNHAAGGDEDIGRDWRADILDERAQPETPLDKVIIR